MSAPETPARLEPSRGEIDAARVKLDADIAHHRARFGPRLSPHETADVSTIGRVQSALDAIAADPADAEWVASRVREARAVLAAHSEWSQAQLGGDQP